MLSNSSGQVVSALVSFKFSVFKRWKSWTVVTICCLASYVVLKEISNRHLILLPPHCFFRKNCSTWVNLLKKTKGCVADGIAKTQKYRLWNNLTRIVESCAEPLCPLRNLHYLINWGDVKGYMDLSPDEKINQNCTVVTIGIGNDTNAEESLRIIAPHCQFYGADPIVSAGSLYDRIGRYFPFAVANRNNISEANVIVNSMNESYAKASVLHRDFVDFITKDVGRQVVDVLFLDGEGAEYVILPYLMKDGKAGRHGILVCQISVELHGPVEKYGLNISRWTQIVTDFLLQSDFVPLWTPQPQYHQRMILINSGANLCRRQIFGSKCY